MRLPPAIAALSLLLLLASPARTVQMAWTPVGNPGNPVNPSDHACFSAPKCGSVGYDYSIGTYEVTNAQYAEFLNAKAKSDPLALWSSSMGSSSDLGGITRSGNSGSYSYSVIAGRGNLPVNYVTFYDAVRFANWMNNGQGNGDTETGSYTLLGGTATPSGGNSIVRNASDANNTIFLSSESEWYKAAYYDAFSASYFAWPAGSNTQITCAAAPTAAANHANCGQNVFLGGDLTPVGSYSGSPSPYGTFDQGGNVAEWNESTTVIFGGTSVGRGFRGGNWSDSPGSLRSSTSGSGFASGASEDIGFRLVMIPEPSTGLLVIAGLLCLAARRERCAQIP